MEQVLANTAVCEPDGPHSAICALVTATDEPFLLRVFADPATTTAYLATIQAADANAASHGLTPRGALIGPRWVVVPKVEAPGLLHTLQRYLGGELYS